VLFEMGEMGKIVCPGCDAARAAASGASLIRDRHRLRRSRVCSAPLRAALRPGHASRARWVRSLFFSCYLQGNRSPVVRGLDPRIHPLREKLFTKIDGLPGQARQ
jgi:hypothetical protein